MNLSKLVRKAQKGDHEAFTKLIKNQEANMYRVSYSILRSNSDCADAIQEGIIKAFTNIHTLREVSFFKSWLIRIVINECNQLIRNKQRVIPMDYLKESRTSSKDFVKIEIHEFLDMLSHDYRLVITLFYFEGYSIKEIAIMLEQPEGTVKTRLHRGRLQLEAMMKEPGKKGV